MEQQITNYKLQTTNFFFVVILAFAMFSCNKDNTCDCLKSTGDNTTEHRTPAGFNKISLEDNINLYITQDTLYSLTVEAGKNLIPLIKSDVTDSCLYLKNENKCNWVRSFKNEINVYLRCKKLNAILYKKASGDIFTNDTLHTDSFQLDNWNGSGKINLTIKANTTWFNLHTGPADLCVKGHSGVNYLYSVGNGMADLRDLETVFTFMNSKSTNNCFVNASNTLEVEIGYIGDVYYTGKPPNIVKNITGAGKLIEL